RLRDGTPQAAIAPLEKAAAASPGLAIVHAYLGEAYLATGRDADGRRELERSLAIDGSQGRPALLLAEALLARRDLATAPPRFGAPWRPPRGGWRSLGRSPTIPPIERAAASASRSWRRRGNDSTTPSDSTRRRCA